MAEADLRKKLDSRWSALKTERSSWDAHWREISDNMLPRAGRFYTSDRNRGQRRHNAILDNTPTRALRILAAGMMSGMTSPARPWFRLSTAQPDLDESAAVKSWLADVQRMMLMVFARSNTYRALHTLYEELGAFGTAATVVVPDFQNVIHHHPLTVGEYAVAADSRGMVSTLYREFDMSVSAIVQEFGLGAVSQTVRGFYDAGNLDSWITVMHAVEPRADRDARRRDARNMPFRSVYWEAGASDGKILRESGFSTFPALCPRWAASGGDIYGNSPGMEALGDAKQLQKQQLAKGRGIEYKTNPPLQAPTSFKNLDLDLLPGGISYVDAVGSTAGIRSAFEVNIDLSHLLADIQDVRGRINSAFYTDLFLLLANDTRSNVTATEVAQRYEEKMLVLGPTVTRFQDELLSPLIDLAFARLVEANLLPPAPDDLAGLPLQVEFVSVMAQAQRAVATASIDRFVGSLGAVAQIKPDVLDKLDADRWADVYADALGVDPDLIVPGEQVALIRQQRAQAQQAAQQAAMADQQAATAQKLAAARTDQQNALTDIAASLAG